MHPRRQMTKARAQRTIGTLKCEWRAAPAAYGSVGGVMPRWWRHFDTPQIDRLRSGEIPSTKAAARSLPGPGKRLLDPVPGWWKLCRLASASPSFRRSMDLVSSDHSPCCGPLHNAPMPYFYVSASRSVPQQGSSRQVARAPWANLISGLAWRASSCRNHS